MLIPFAAGSTAELATGRFQDAARWGEYDIIGWGPQQVRDHGLDLAPELRQHPRLRLARLSQHHQAFRASSRIRAAKDCHTPPAQASDIAQGFFQFMRINIAPSTDDDVFRAIRGGARGYLLKGSPAAEIAHAIRQVHAGESFLSPRIAAKLVKGVTLPPGRTGLLSARELGVLRLVAAGLSNRQIAETLTISERTVKFHVTAIFNKLGADNRAQAVAIAAERGLLSGR